MSYVRRRFLDRLATALAVLLVAGLGTVFSCGGGGHDDSEGALAGSTGGAAGNGSNGGGGSGGSSTASSVEQYSYTDNGDGTITDNVTGLQWEKKIARDGIRDGDDLHDADNCHPWKGSCGLAGSCRTSADCGSGTCSALDCQGGSGMTAHQWVAKVNEENFAGHSDWRLPTVRELQTLLDYRRFNPCIDPAFEGSECGGDCTDMTKPECSCTAKAITPASAGYWSSSDYVLPDTPDAAWQVNFAAGFVYENFVIVDFYVRAVRTAG